MEYRNRNISIVVKLMLSFALSPFLIGCSGGGSPQRTNSGELTVDESLSPEQQLEMYKLQTNSFADSVFRADYNILYKDVDSLFYVFYAKRDTIESGHFCLEIVTKPPIMYKDIQTGSTQEIPIPTSIDGRQIKINMIIGYTSYEDKIIMSVTGKSPNELDEADYESFDILYLDGQDHSFHYVVGGRPWYVGKQSIYDHFNWKKIPFSEIFDGTYKNNSAILENNQITTENLEEQSSQPATSSPNVVSAKSGSVSQHSEQVNAAPAAQVREEKTTASQTEQKAKANAGPEFQGGNYALTSYIAKHIHYPPVAAEKKIQGKVVVKLTISSTGQVSNAEIVQSVDPMLDAEALRLCKSLPRFTPARRNGQPVASTMSIPINFRL